MSLEYDDVPPSLQCLFEIVGEDKFLKIVDMYGGFMVYIPTGKSIRRGSRNREIIKRYNGKNAVTLSKEYGISHTHLINIIKDFEK